MIKILFIEATELRGGIESFILNISCGLDKSKYSLSLLTSSDKASIEEEFENIGGKVIHISSFKHNKLQYMKDINNVIKTGNFDVVHINKNSLANPFSIFVCKKYNVGKIVLHSHNTHPTQGRFSGVIHNFFKYVIKKDNIVKVACSEKARDWMFGKNDDVLILRNGVEIKKYRFDLDRRKKKREELLISNDTVVICSVGRMCEQKNSLFILDIFNSFLKKSPDSLLVMIGNGELKDKVEERVYELGIDENVRLLGVRNDIPDLLQAMDLFLMPSLHEGLPIAAVEAQASGLPMLISDTVDRDVAILRTSEFESLGNNSDIWADHIVELIKKNTRKDTCLELSNAGYDLGSAVEILSRVYI